MPTKFEDLLNKQQNAGTIKTASDAVQRRVPRNIINDRPVASLADLTKPTAIAGKGFVGPRNNPGITSKEAQSFINRPAFETIAEQSKEKISSKLGRVLQLAKGLATPAAILAPAAGLIPALTDSKATTQQKIDAGVEATGGIAGGIGGAALAKTGVALGNIVRSAPLPPLAKLVATVGGATLGAFGGQALAREALKEPPNQLPVVAQAVQQEEPISESPQFSSPVPARQVGGGGVSIGGAAGGSKNSLLGIANRRLAENQALLSRPGAVEIIRGLNRSAFLGDGVEVSLEPGVEIGRERAGRAFGQPGVAAKELQTDAQRDVAGLSLAGRLAAANKPPTLNQLQGVLAQQALSGSPEEASAAIQQAETLGQIKSALSGKKKSASPFEVEKRKIAEILADSDSTEDDKNVALGRAKDIKMIELLLGE